ncbi:MAG: peroxiredoxin family protein [Thermodesulfobacteriota bacterium]
MKAASKVLSLFVAIQLLIMLSAWPISAGDPAHPSQGTALPPITLPIPKVAGEKRYLGLSGNGHFKIFQIKAKAVILRIFSLYCPICQSTAAETADLYHRIESDPDLKGKIKLIGIGAGNTSYEVGVFKETYRIPFPLFPDEDFTIHKALGEVRTPYSLTMRIGDGAHQVVHTQSGNIAEPDQFIGLILKACGLARNDLPEKSEDLAILPQQPQSN